MLLLKKTNIFYILFMILSLSVKTNIKIYNFMNFCINLLPEEFFMMKIPKNIKFQKKLIFVLFIMATSNQLISSYKIIKNFLIPVLY